MDVQALGRVLLVVGVVIALVGVLLLLVGRVPVIGRLPGDLVIQRDGFTCFIPLATGLLLSLLLTILLNLVLRLLR